jgi:uncharacterized membrane protein YeaQ/YmgE (transglycosylase-associated protein family)
MHQHHLIGVLIIGLIIGIVAKLLMPGRDPGGCIVTMLLGIAGAAFGTYVGHLLGFYPLGHRAGFIGSVIGAMLILLIYRAIIGKRP